jgi:hypothetical protein
MAVHAVQWTCLKSNSYVLSVRQVVLLVKTVCSLGKTGSAFWGIPFLRLICKTQICVCNDTLLDPLLRTMLRAYEYHVLCTM